MGCATSGAVPARGTPQKPKAQEPEPEQEPDRDPVPELVQMNNLHLDVEPAGAPLTASTSFRDWNEVISFETFVEHGDKPQIFEYEFIRKIGRGAQAEVYLVKNVETQELLAAKVYDKAFLYRANLGDAEPPIQKAINEIQIMTMVKHPNCLGLREVLDDEYTNVIIIVQPYADCGSLVPQQSKTEPMPEEKARFYFFQIAMGVRHLHEHNIVHRDIKPENIMRFADGRVAIADFSASLILEDPNGLLEDTDGTPAFYAPEQCSGKPYQGKPCDVWATGVSLYFILFGKLPFFSISNEGMFLAQFFRITKQIQENEVEFDTNINVSDEAKDLILKILNKNPQARLTIDQVLEHEWLKPCYNDPALIRIEETPM